MGWSWSDALDTPLEVLEYIRARMSAENKEQARQNRELERNKK